MQSKTKSNALSLGILASAVALASVTTADAAPRKTWKRAKAPAASQARAVGIQRATSETVLSQGRGQLINLPSPISDIFVANDAVADVQVRSPTQLYVFGKSKGETSVYATNAAGTVVYSTNLRVAQNINSLDAVMKASFPDSDITAYTIGQTVVLAGTVLSPDESAQAERIAKGLMNPGINLSDPNAFLDVVVINRLKMATPTQVSLRVRIAEVSRSFTKQFGLNWKTLGSGSSNPFFGITQGQRDPGTIIPGVGGQPSQYTFTAGTANNTIGLAGRLLGTDILGALDIGETEGFVTTLASPTLTSVSGEKANFLVGGQIPIPITNLDNGILTTSVLYRDYGIKLEFAPVVLADGRISMKVRPEVSELDYTNAITINGSRIPGTTNRQVEATVELGSGQSLVIGGLMRASNSNTVNKLPGAGNIPILGSLFRSTNFQRGETELMIVVTPYLVRGVSDDKIVLPTDGYKAPTDLGRIFNGELYNGASERRPGPTLSTPETVARPSVGASLQPRTKSTPAPGFSN
jgi:pilus assembly protein CpaC